jgi:hypothetical protein
MRSIPSPLQTNRSWSPYIAMPSSGAPRPAGGKISPSTGMRWESGEELAGVMPAEITRDGLEVQPDVQKRTRLPNSTVAPTVLGGALAR